MSSVPFHVGTLHVSERTSILGPTRARSGSRSNRTSFAGSSDTSQHGDDDESGFSRGANDSQLHNSAWETLARWSEAPSDAEASVTGDDEDEAVPELPTNFKRREAWVIARLTAPIWMTHLLEMSNAAAGVVSLGHMGTTELAAAALGSLTANVFGFSVVVGWVSALDTVLPPVFSQNPKQCGVWAQRMAVLSALLSVPILSIWYFTEPLLLSLGQDPEVSALAGRYIRRLSFGLLPFMGFEICRKYLQSQGLVHAPTIVLIVASPLNAFLNWLFVWGPIERLNMGFVGSPTAIVVFFWTAFVISFVLCCYLSRIPWSGWTRDAFKVAPLARLARIAAAGTIAVISEWWAWDIVGLLTSRLGVHSLAAQSILLTSSNLSYQLAYALSSATAVRIGNLLGAKRPLAAKLSSEVGLLLSIGAGVFNSALFMAFRTRWGSFFTRDAATIAIVTQILPLLALFQIADALTGVAGGVLRGTGRQGASATISLTAYYVIGLPIGLVLTFLGSGPHLGLAGMWIGLTIALVYGAVTSFALIGRTDWDAEVRKASQLSETAPLLPSSDIEDPNVNSGATTPRPD